MTERITLRAKSNGTEISGVLVSESPVSWGLALAPDAGHNRFFKSEWDRVYTLPTKPGTVFRATVRGVENVRVMVAPATPYDKSPYCSAVSSGGVLWHFADHIDPSTVVIELEGDES